MSTLDILAAAREKAAAGGGLWLRYFFDNPVAVGLISAGVVVGLVLIFIRMVSNADTAMQDRAWAFAVHTCIFFATIIALFLLKAGEAVVLASLRSSVGLS